MPAHETSGLVNCIQELGPAAAVFEEDLGALLQHESGDVRANAAMAVQYFAYSDRTTQLLVSLLEDESEVVRANAVSSLGWSLNPESQSTIRAAVRHVSQDPSSLVQSARRVAARWMSAGLAEKREAHAAMCASWLRLLRAEDREE